VIGPTKPQAKDGPFTMRHGGDPGLANQLYGTSGNDWLDLSTGVNPWPWPNAADLAGKASLDRFPTRHAMTDMLMTARTAYGAAEPVAVCALPGTEILIHLLPFLVAGPSVLVETSYCSYDDAWCSADKQLPTIAADAIGTIETDISVILINPNNPDGRVLDKDAVMTLIRSRTGNAIVIVDEAYAEAEAGMSIVPDLAPENPALVLKSFGKFFGLPGLRLGFAFGNPHVVGHCARLLGDWPVSSTAVDIGTAALADAAWQNEIRRRLADQCTALDNLLTTAGFNVIGRTNLFLLIAADDATGLHEGLARRGIWTRIFAEKPQWLRIGLPPDEPAMQRLASALNEFRDRVG
jgi:cobalamin biosynthetic protein CobC